MAVLHWKQGLLGDKKLSFINLKPIYILIPKGDNYYSAFQETNKVSTNNFKTDIEGISDWLEMCKDLVSV